MTLVIGLVCTLIQEESQLMYEIGKVIKSVHILWFFVGINFEKYINTELYLFIKVYNNWDYFLGIEKKIALTKNPCYPVYIAHLILYGQREHCVLNFSDSIREHFLIVICIWAFGNN